MEEFSAFIDGELAERDTNQLIDATKTDADVRGTFARYHLIGDVMRTTLPERISPHFADAVSTAIATEPTVLAPKSRARSIVKTVTGFTIAAIVAAIAVLGLQRIDNRVRQSEPQIAESGMGNSATSQQATLAELGFEGRRIVPFASRLNSYLVNHNQYKSNIAVHGVVSYARMVGYEANR